jgi:hypothetical protein
MYSLTLTLIKRNVFGSFTYRLRACADVILSCHSGYNVAPFLGLDLGLGLRFVCANRK